jgi:hypothetical protein
MKVERVTLKDVVILAYTYDAEVTRRHCRFHGLHWPHVIAVEHSTLQGVPTEVTVCPGESGQGLRICEGRYRYTIEWLIIDTDAVRRASELKEHPSPYWEVEQYPELELGRIVYEGTRRECKCSIGHLPHAESAYDTVRWGTLHTYCPGLSGRKYDLYEYRWHGDAQQPDRSVVYVIWCGCMEEDENGKDNAEGRA